MYLIDLTNILTFIDMSMKSVVGVALAAYKEQQVGHYSCFTVDKKMLNTI